MMLRAGGHSVVASPRHSDPRLRNANTQDHFVATLYPGLAAQFSFSANVLHSRASGFSMSNTSLAARWTTILSPVLMLVVSWPSHESAVPRLTRLAVISTLFCEEMTIGRNDRLCGQMGVMQTASI